MFGVCADSVPRDPRLRSARDVTVKHDVTVHAFSDVTRNVDNGRRYCKRSTEGVLAMFHVTSGNFSILPVKSSMIIPAMVEYHGSTM